MWMPASSRAGLTSSLEGARVPLLQLVRLRDDVGEHVERRPPDVGRHREPGRDAALEAGDAHHEELVEVGGEDRQEVGALEQRDGRVLGQLEHALVEGEPAQLAVEVAVSGQRAVVDGVDGLESSSTRRAGRCR